MSQTENWEQNKGHLVEAAAAAGIDPGIMARIAGFESGFRPDARPVHRRAALNRVSQFDGVMAMSSGYGLGQFLDGTWKEMVNAYGDKYGIADASSMTETEANDPQIRADPAIQAAMLAEFTRENIERGRALGGADADANVYAFHNLGAGDARRFLRGLAEDPNQRVDSILSARVIIGNPGLYGDGSRTIAESYRVMGGLMREYDAYAIEAIEMTAAFRGVPYAISEPRPLNVGSRGHSVQSLQEDLNSIGATNSRGEQLIADGDFGRNTKDAIESFQRRNDLPMTGNADKETLAAIQFQIGAVRSADGVERAMRQFQSPGYRNDWMQTDERGLPNYLHAAVDKPHHDDLPQNKVALADGFLKIGERGPEVAKLQESLIQLGINDHVKQPIKADGVFGPDTQRAVQAFQLWHGADHVSGIADRQTLTAIHTQAGLAIIQRTTDKVHGAPAHDFVANANIGARVDPNAAANPREAGRAAGTAELAPARAAPPITEPATVAPATRATLTPAKGESAVDAIQLSSNDKAMFVKIRDKVGPEVPDEIVAKAMLEAKRNGIQDADRVGQVGVVEGQLWVGGTTPGFLAGVSTAGPAPAMQDTLRETQAFNHQLTRDAAQRGPDDPNRGPKMQ